MTARPAAGVVSALVLAASVVGSAADLSSYRTFRFGDDVVTVATQAGIRPTSVKVIHQRPHLIQEMEWYGPSIPLDPIKPDPVSGGILSFLDGKLYRIVITYDRYRIEGLTVEELIGAISQTYGPAERPGTEIPFPTSYGDVAKVIARWQDAKYACDLVRTGDGTSFALTAYSKQEEVLAEAAIHEAARLDRIEAPRKAVEEELKRAEAERLALEKTRATNKRNFRP